MSRKTQKNQISISSINTMFSIMIVFFQISLFSNKFKNFMLSFFGLIRITENNSQIFPLFFSIKVINNILFNQLRNFFHKISSRSDDIMVPSFLLLYFLIIPQILQFLKNFIFLQFTLLYIFCCFEPSGPLLIQFSSGCHSINSKINQFLWLNSINNNIHISDYIVPHVLLTSRNWNLRNLWMSTGMYKSIHV